MILAYRIPVRMKDRALHSVMVNTTAHVYELLLGHSVQVSKFNSVMKHSGVSSTSTMMVDFVVGDVIA